MCWMMSWIFVHKSKEIPSELSHWFFSINKPGNCILDFIKLSSKIFLTACVPIPFRNELTLTLIWKSNGKETTNSLLRPIFTSPALVLRVNVVFCFPPCWQCFAVRSLGWVEMSEEDMAPGKSSVAVNNCIRQLSYHKHNLHDTAGIWGEVRRKASVSCNSHKPPSVVFSRADATTSMLSTIEVLNHHGGLWQSAITYSLQH